MKIHVVLLAAILVVAVSLPGWAYQYRQPGGDPGPSFGSPSLGPMIPTQQPYGVRGGDQSRTYQQQPGSALQPSAIGVQPDSGTQPGGIQPGSAEDHNLRERAADEERRRQERGPFNDTLPGQSYPQPTYSDPTAPRLDPTQMRERLDRDLSRYPSPSSSSQFDATASDRQSANSATKWAFHGDLSNFILYDTYGTGAFWFRDTKGTPRLFVVFLTQDPPQAKPDGFVRYHAHNAEGGIARWAFYVGGSDQATPSAGNGVTVANDKTTKVQARGAIYLWLADPNKKKEWHLYEEATRVRGQ